MDDEPTRASETVVASGARIAVACLAVLLLVGAGDWGLAVWLRDDPTYRSLQDPRRRVLWDARYDGSSVVLVGDSAFASYYVDAAPQTLWERLARLSGAKVFPAVLDGATPTDLALVARTIASRWPARTTVFIDLLPTRLYVGHLDSVRPESRYASRLGMTPPDDQTPFPHNLDRALSNCLAARLFLVRHQEEFHRYVSGRIVSRRPQFYGIDPDRNRVWNLDGKFAANRFGAFEKALAARSKELIVAVRWVQELNAILTERALTPVFVITPLNRDLIREYTLGVVPTERLLMQSHDFLIGELRAAGLEYLDLCCGLDSTAFADLNHTNIRGDALLASALNDWMTTRGRAGRDEQQDPGASVSFPVR